jgi:hypothetical protein
MILLPAIKKNSDIESNTQFTLKDQNLTTKQFLPPLLADAITTLKFEYDDKVNPLHLLNISALLALNGRGERRYLTLSYCKNNLTQEARGIYDYMHRFRERNVTTYTYKYNNAGLPVECEISYLEYKWLMEYY